MRLLSEEEKIFKDSILDFTKNVLLPQVSEMDQKEEIPQALLKECFQRGYMGIEVPEAYGGSGGSLLMSCLLIETIAQVDPSLSILVDVQNTLVNSIFMNYGTEEQKQKYLTKLCTSSVGAYALSESFSGSDAFALQTKARKQDQGFVLKGRKMWITNAYEADVFIVFANTQPEKGYKGITAFIIERDFQGFSVGKKEEKLGIKASSTCELILEDCLVPKENVIGNVGEGYKIAIETLNIGRIGIGAQMYGLAQGAYECTKKYIKEREQFGKKISEFQGVQFQLAEMKSYLEAMGLLVYNTAQKKEANQDIVTSAAICKWFTSVYAEKITSQCLNLFGGNGFSKEYPIEKFYRDSKIGQIYEGTNNIQLQTIAKQELKA
ncbi:MAG: acyl-CoA dehydrogenase family protein [Bdellovibrionales bacterium]